MRTRDLAKAFLQGEVLCSFLAANFEGLLSSKPLRFDFLEAVVMSCPEWSFGTHLAFSSLSPDGLILSFFHFSTGLTVHYKHDLVVSFLPFHLLRIDTHPRSPPFVADCSPPLVAD